MYIDAFNESSEELSMKEVNDQFLEAFKSNNCLINYRFGNIPVHMNEKKQRRILWWTRLVKTLPRFPNELWRLSKAC